MGDLKITVLKRNAPWGPFSREQIEEGLRHGDYTLKYLAHAPGLREWLPLGEVIDYVEKHTGPSALPVEQLPYARPPIPDSNPFPEPTSPPAKPPIPEFRDVVGPPPSAKPPMLPASPHRPVSSPPPPAIPMAEPADSRPELHLVPAPFVRRAIAFVIDCFLLFVPVLLLFAFGALCIEIPAAWHHISHQARMEEWDLLELNVRRLAWIVAVGLGWIYGAGLESSPSQATVGKRWMGLKVVDGEGHRIGFLRATGRYAAKYASALPCFLGFFAALFSHGNLALHDRISDTRVVRK